MLVVFSTPLNHSTSLAFYGESGMSNPAPCDGRSACHMSLYSKMEKQGGGEKKAWMLSASAWQT